MCREELVTASLALLIGSGALGVVSVSLAARSQDGLQSELVCPFRGVVTNAWPPDSLTVRIGRRTAARTVMVRTDSGFTALVGDTVQVMGFVSEVRLGRGGLIRRDQRRR